LGALHHSPKAAIVEAQHRGRSLHDHAHLVVVLAAGQPGAVRRRTYLDEENHRLRSGGISCVTETTLRRVARFAGPISGP